MRWYADIGELLGIFFAKVEINPGYFIKYIFTKGHFYVYLL